MVSWSTQMRSMRNVATSTAIALFLMSGNAVAQDVPGDLWVVNYVKVTGANQDAVRSGLRAAADTYFYGFDTETHMEANAKADGTFDLRVIGPGGKVLAQQNGLSYNPAGNIARSVSSSARSWMNDLGCAEGCAVAVSGGAPSPSAVQPVQVAAAAEAAIERVETEAPKPEAVEESAEIATPEAPAAEVKIVEAPKAVAPTVSVPSAPVETGDLKVAAKPVETKKPEGLDADLVLARPNVSAAPSANASQARKPVTPKPAAAPKVPEVRSVAKPTIAAAPSAGSGSSAPTTPTVRAQKPVVEAKPEVPTTPEVKVAEPRVQPVETPEVATSTETSQPSVASVVPDAAATPEVPVTDVPDSAVTAQTAEQEVAPGVSLPAPTAGSTPATVAEIAERAKPEVSAEIPATPSVPTVATPAPADVAMAIEPVVPETSTPAESSDDGDGEQLALVNPQREVSPLPTPTASAADTEALAPKPEQVETAAEAAAQPEETESTTTVETRIAAVDPTAEGPTLANARWVGFTPAVFTGSDNKAGAWISGPFDRKQRTGWITDTATGATTRVTFIWREGGSGSRTALLSREAAKALGLGQGDVANVAVYLPR